MTVGPALGGCWCCSLWMDATLLLLVFACPVVAVVGFRVMRQGLSVRGVGGGRGVEGGRAWGFLVNWGGVALGKYFLFNNLEIWKGA